MDKMLVRPEEVASAIGVSRSLAYRLFASGAIPSVRLDGSAKSVRVRVEVLKEWIDNQSANAVTREEGA